MRVWETVRRTASAALARVREYVPARVRRELPAAVGEWQAGDVPAPSGAPVGAPAGTVQELSGAPAVELPRDPWAGRWVSPRGGLRPADVRRSGTFRPGEDRDTGRTDTDTVPNQNVTVPNDKSSTPATASDVA